MLLDLSPREAEILEALLGAVLSERLHQIHHAHSRDYRKLLENEAELIEGIRTRLSPQSTQA